MMYRVNVKYYCFDFIDLQEACNFALQAKNSYVPDAKDDYSHVSIHIIDDTKVEEVEE